MLVFTHHNRMCRDWRRETCYGRPHHVVVMGIGLKLAGKAHTGQHALTFIELSWRPLLVVTFRVWESFHMPKILVCRERGILLWPGTMK